MGSHGMAWSLSRLHGAGAIVAIGQGVAASVLIAATTMLAGIVTARYLGAAGRGELAALTTLPAFFSFVLTVGLPSGLVYHLRRPTADTGGMVAAALLLSLLAGLLGAAFAYVAVPWVLGGLPRELLGIARALVVFTILGVVSNVLMAAIQAQHRFAAYNYVRVAQPVAQLLGMLVLGLTGWMTPVTAALVVLLSGLPGLSWSVFWVYSRCKPAWRRWRGAASELASYGARAYGGELLLAVANQADRVIVVGIFAPAVMGIYVVALSLSRLVTMFPSAVVSVLFPKASGRSESEVMRITSRAAGATALVVGISAGVLIVFGPELLALFYGSEFRGAALAFRLLVAEAALASIVQVLSQAFMALNRPGLITWQYGSGALVAIPLLWVLAPIWGAAGAAAALLCASVVRLVCTYWCFTGVLKIAPPRVFVEIGASVSSLKAALLTGLR